MTKYTNEIIQFIIENFKGRDNIELAELVNEKFNMNVDRVSIANVKKRILKSFNINLKNGINRGCFQKGQVSLNKGKKWNDYMSEKGQINSRKTCFKKGNIPKNHREVGSERINVYGYYEIKVAEPNVWKLKHRVIYENAHGFIPKDCMIIFADGNKSNFNLDNLVLVSKSENLHMNKDSLRFNDAELTKTGLNITKVKLKLSEKKNKNN